MINLKDLDGKTHFTFLLEIPSGISEEEVRQRMRSFLFGANGAARESQVKLTAGSLTRTWIDTHLVTPTSSEAKCFCGGGIDCCG